MRSSIRESMELNVLNSEAFVPQISGSLTVNYVFVRAHLSRSRAEERRVRHS